MYGAQNEAYMCRSAENVVRGLCFNELDVGGRNDVVKRSVYIGLHLVYFWGTLRLHRATHGFRWVYMRFASGSRCGMRVAEAAFLCRF